ncbi:hypothetical protein [Alterisphingorhabdus coralli]|uniref:Uncharacterized protein n=1 Tax=Alterisphingorhabdus coralli TaxID=3071408 RepID=A0AA97F922_9SPHN|nr:hypothetical protein [Parasphingorhabdus sp. SCSIO 66989]WOE76141.1 hypothetical protein RB602_05350 [Parasphingorhabdus sp. SCSIO 66989]
MIIGILFIALAFFACIYGIIAGERDGRIAALLFVAATVASYFADTLSPWVSLVFGIFLVDVILLAGLYWLALSSRYFWPLWACGIHSVAVITHMASLIAPSFLPEVYQMIQGFWAIPTLLSMVIGIWLTRSRGASGYENRLSSKARVPLDR